MTKKWGRRIFKYLLLFLLVFIFANSSAKAEGALSFDPDGYWRVSTYEELEKATDYNWSHRWIRLTEDIIVSDSKNDRELFFNGTESVIIDLNGHTIQRTTRSLDTSLFHLMNGASLTILDTSEEQTGEVNFINNDSEYAYTYLISSTDSRLSIYGGSHTVQSENASYSETVCAEGGSVEIYGGVFDCRKGSGFSANIGLNQLNHFTEAPRCAIYDGTFYGKYNNLEISPMSVMPSGSKYSAIYVMGGDFYLNKYDTKQNYGGFAYCNNGWGRVIVAGGKIPAYSLNKGRDVIYVSGAAREVENYTFDGCTQPYETVSHPPLIVSETFTKEDRLKELCIKAEAQWYLDNMKPGGSFDQAYGDALREIGEQKIELFVSGNTYESPEVKLEGAGANDRITWYGAYDYDGSDATWQEFKNVKNQAGPWRLDMRPDAETIYYIKTVVSDEKGGSTEDIIKIYYQKVNKILQGKPMIYMNNPYFGNRLYAGIFDVPSWQKKSDYTYEWKLDGKTVGTEEVFILDDPSYIGKSLNCTIRSTAVEGELTTNTVVVRKAANNGTPVTPGASYDAKWKRINLSFLRSDQEYLFSAKKSVKELTEDDWIWSKKPEDTSGTWYLSYVDLEEYEGELIYIYTRFKETETGRKGEKVIGIPLMLAEYVGLKDICFRDSIEGKIYIPFTGKGEEVILYYDTDPFNANQWNGFTWINPGWPVKITQPTGTITSENNMGMLHLELVSTGTTDLLAYTSNGTQIKKQTIVVYDPENPLIGEFNVVKPLQDQVMEVGTVFVSEMPEIIPEPPESMELQWFFTDLTQYDQPHFSECEVAKINPETGEIQALSVGSVTVALVRTNENGYYNLATFELTVRGSGTLIPVKELLISKTELTLQERENYSLEVLVLPANASDKNVTWTTSDERIVNVESGGKVQAISEGVAVVTATVDGKKVECTVIVEKNPLLGLGAPETEDSTEKIDGKWVYSSAGWWYSYSSGGYPRNEWKKIDGSWYLFDSLGYMKTGWQYIGGQWYYLSSSGAMVTGWQYIGGQWYYFSSSGAMVTGWQYIGGQWYYLSSSGAMVTGWQYIGGQWYYMNSSGQMCTGWIFVNSKWYYMVPGSGVMHKGWLQSDGNWYYLASSGEMVVGRVVISGQVNNFNSSGVWLGY